MKKSYLFAAALAAGMSFASCSNDENVENVAMQSSLNVESVGLQGMNSRSGITAGSFTNGESLGLYIYAGAKSDLASVTPTYSDGGNEDLNIQYTEASGKWSPASLPIVLSSKVGTVYAVYPYDAANTDPSQIAITVAETQGTGQSDGSKLANGQYDYMWATPAENVSNATAAAAKVNLTMNHALAMVTFKFKQADAAADEYPGVGHVTSIKLFNDAQASSAKPILTGAAKLNIANGAISGATASVNGITVNPDTDLMDVTTESLLPRMLIYPSVDFIAGEAKMTFVIDESTYTLNVPAMGVADSGKGYEAGNNYIYTLTMKGTKLEVESVSIKPWVGQELTGGDIQTPDQI